MAVGKPNHVITLHLLKAAPKMTRLDEAGLKKRAATRGDVVVEVKPGDSVLSLTDTWEFERFVELGKKPEGKSKRPEAKSEPKAAKTEQLELLMPSQKGKKPPTAEKPAVSKKTPEKTTAKDTAVKKPVASKPKS
jgi:hypothetical protein